MPTLAPPPQQPVIAPPDPQALIEEARRRQRRRRWSIAGVVVLLACVSAVYVAFVRGGANRTTHVSGGPIVDVAAFAGHGRLAFISGRTVWVLDGATRSLRRIALPIGSYPSQPLFSRDGCWLAFVQTTTRPWYVPGSGAQVGRLWLAHGDGTDAHVVLANAQPIGWSPARDVLAVAAGPVSKRVPFGSLTTVRLVAPDGRARTRVAARGIWSGAWSPRGDQLAVITWDAPQHLTLATYPIGRPGRTVWSGFAPRTHLNGMNDIVADVAGWWPGLGIGLWVYGDGMVHNNDETPLDLITAPRSRPRYLTDTLSDGTTRVFASAHGRLAVVADVSGGVNGGRVVWDQKQLQLCARNGCTAVGTNRRTVTLDPAWSPNGRLLAYVEAPDRTSGPWTQRTVSRWYGDHRLRILDVETGRTRAIAAARGATVPLWSPDGRSLLFVRDDGIWLLPSLRARPVDIARPLFKGAWPNYYGQMAWPAQFAWWSG